MGVSETAQRAAAGSRAQPLERPLKVYVTTAGDESASQEVLKSIRKINSKPNQVRTIEVVNDISKANVILVHYELTEKRREEVDNNMTMDPGLKVLSLRSGSGKAAEAALYGVTIKWPAIEPIHPRRATPPRRP